MYERHYWRNTNSAFFWNASCSKFGVSFQSINLAFENHANLKVTMNISVYGEVLLGVVWMFCTINHPFILHGKWILILYMF